VLITLAIIGIIAAITIPTIVANHQKKHLETAFTKGYRTVSHMINLARAEHGDFSSWDWESAATPEGQDAFVKKYFLPYLNTVKFCPADNSSGGCFPNVTYKFLNGKNSSSNYETIDRTSVLLADGMSYTFFFPNPTTCMNIKSRCVSIAIDTNGFKKPNTIGYDFVSFEIFPATGEFLPRGINVNKFNAETNDYDKLTWEQLLQRCSVGGSDNHLCSGRIVQEGFKINY